MDLKSKVYEYSLKLKFSKNTSTEFNKQLIVLIEIINNSNMMLSSAPIFVNVLGYDNQNMIGQQNIYQKMIG